MLFIATIKNVWKLLAIIGKHSILVTPGFLDLFFTTNNHDFRNISPPSLKVSAFQKPWTLYKQGIWGQAMYMSMLIMKPQQCYQQIKQQKSFVKCKYENLRQIV